MAAGQDPACIFKYRVVFQCEGGQTERTMMVMENDGNRVATGEYGSGEAKIGQEGFWVVDSERDSLPSAVLFFHAARQQNSWPKRDVN